MNGHPQAPRPTASRRIARSAKRFAHLGAAACLLVAMAACTPTEGQDSSFQPVPTTNKDYAKAVPITVGNLPISMDVTCTGGTTCADGQLDLVAIVNNLAQPALFPDGSINPTGTVTILRNSPVGTITKLATLVTGQFPSIARWADLDGGAGELDLVVLDNLNERLEVYLNSGAGWPVQPSQSFSLGDAAAQMELVDLDGSGTPNDIVLTVPTLTEIVALVNNGAGFDPPVATVTGSALGRFFAANLDATAGPNTDLDLALLSPVNSLVEFWKGDGTGIFSKTLATSSIGITSVPSYISGGDLLGSGNQDVAILSNTGTTTNAVLTVLGGDGAGNFSQDPIGLPLGAHDVLVLSSGASPDVAVLHTNQSYFSFLQGPVGSVSVTFPATTRSVIDVREGQVDADGSGFADLITAESEKRAVGVFAGDGAGGFSRTQIGFESKVVFPRLVNVKGPAGAGEPLDLLLLQPNEDRLLVLLNTHH